MEYFLLYGNITNFNLKNSSTLYVGVPKNCHSRKSGNQNSLLNFYVRFSIGNPKNMGRVSRFSFIGFPFDS